MTEVTEKITVACQAAYARLPGDKINDVVAMIVVEGNDNSISAGVILEQTGSSFDSYSDDYKLNIIIEHILGKKLFDRDTKTLFIYKKWFERNKDEVLSIVKKSINDTGLPEEPYYAMFINESALPILLKYFKNALGKDYGPFPASKLYVKFTVNLYKNMFPEGYDSLIEQLKKLRVVETDSNANDSGPMILFIQKSAILDETFKNAVNQKQEKNRRKISNEDDPTAINNNGPASSIMLKMLARMTATIGALVAGACAYALKNPMTMPWLTLHLSPAAIFVIAIGAVIVTLMSLYFLFKKGPSPRQSSPNSAGCLNFFKRLINPSTEVGRGDRRDYPTISSQGSF